MSHDALKFWADERDTFIVPDVFQKDILAGTAGFEFFRGKDRVVDLASELPLQLAYGLPITSSLGCQAKAKLLGL